MTSPLASFADTLLSVRPLGLAVVLAAAVCLVFAAPAAAELCAKCKDMMFIESIGHCKVCKGDTASGAFQLCKACSAKLGECENCRAQLASAAPVKTPDAKPTPTSSAAAPTPTGSAAAAAALPFTSLLCETSGGFAGVQQKITIDAAGKFKITEGRPARAADGQFTQAEIADLAKLAAAVDWKAAEARYIDPRIADGFVVSLTVTIGETTHRTVVGDPPPAKAPAALVALMRHVRELRQKHLQDAAKPEK
jgi:hypothetical protein